MIPKVALPIAMAACRHAAIVQSLPGWSAMTYEPSAGGCCHLARETHAGRRSRIGDINSRIPGNLDVCPDFEEVN